MKKISIIIPVYNIKAELLYACFDSLVNQINENIEVIVIDDGSTNEARNICDEYSNMFKIIHTENNGVANARNVGILESSGEWITFIDSDDYVCDTYVESLIECLDESVNVILFDYKILKSNKEIPVSLPFKNGIIDNNNFFEIQKAYFYKYLINNKEYFFNHNVVWNKLYKKIFLIENKIFFIKTARSGQDYIFNAEVFLYITKIRYFKKQIYYYRILENSISHGYKPNIIENHNICQNRMFELVDKFSLNYEYKELLFTGIMVSWISILRNYKKNKDLSIRQKKKEIRSIIKNEPYKSACSKYSNKYLKTSLKIFAFMVKHHMWRICNLMIDLDDYFNGK